ncbi:spore coat protein GerQ [Paenibacillus apiarius]|uniref:spore coat protein GerQ n=1 Tax=Paenibacillus apiarius TaxID=46240 RepID=UPI00197EB570|nr:spore coat protein GerQ [Paenibacillus apiarius]
MHYMVPQAPQTAQPVVTPPPVVTLPPVVTPPPVASGNVMTPAGMVIPGLGEQSYIENILRLNLGKVGTFYFTYENNSEWNAKVFRGMLEAAGRDHIIISDPMTGQRIMLLMVNFDYATFDEPLNYQYPYGLPARTDE